jgi:prepilin-type N-terminal cleavage/methylation domain-containing protein
MGKKLNQQGITLVELIAALALVSMVAVLIMTTLSIGIKQSIIENDKVQIQQQSNLIVSQLLKIHRKGEPYCMELFQDTTDNSDTFVNLRIMDYECVSNKMTILPDSMNYNIKVISIDPN